MKEIKEYILDSKSFGKQTIYLPVDAEIVAVKQLEEKVVLFYLTDPLEVITSIRTIVSCKTSEAVFTDKLLYIGNYTDDVFGIIHILVEKEDFE